MNNKFLCELQEDIFDKGGYYVLYVVIAFPSFIITIGGMELQFIILRIILSGIALSILALIYLKCKSSRSEKENKKIIYDIYFFLMLTLTCVYELMKHLN